MPTVSLLTWRILFGANNKMLRSDELGSFMSESGEIHGKKRNINLIRKALVLAIP